MTTKLDVWGFSHVLTVETDVPEFCKALNREAESRGIRPNVPSDALDLSRDLMLTDAAWKQGALWSIDGDTLRLWRHDLTVDWDAVEAAVS